MRFHGVYTALITPMDKEGYVDYQALDQLIYWQKESGVSGVVILGSTGEFLSLTLEEKKEIIRVSVKHQSATFQIIVGVGSSDTRDSVEMSSVAESFNVDGIMAVVPYYVKPSQDGLYAHFSSIAKSVDLPLILYDNPGRAGSQLDIDTIIAIHNDHKNVLGLKDSGPLSRTAQLVSRLPSSIQILNGHDDFSLPYLSMGVNTVISVTSNVVPTLMCDVYKYYNDDNYSMAKKTFFYLLPLINMVFVETSPIPIKYMIHSIFQHISPMVRLPLTSISESRKNEIQTLLNRYIDRHEA